VIFKNKTLYIIMNYKNNVQTLQTMFAFHIYFKINIIIIFRIFSNVESDRKCTLAQKANSLIKPIISIL